jgi:predicted RND superfamily exporter protein
MIASHQGIFSLGLLLTLGSACGLAAALIVLPVLLKLTSKPGARPAWAERESAA